MTRFIPSVSTFEKVLVANTLIILAEAAGAWWVTRHALESYHYLIDTSFLVITAALSLTINIFVLRAAFRPLFGLLSTIQSIEAGEFERRAQIPAHDKDVAQLAAALNAMLDRLEAQRQHTTSQIFIAQEQERRHLALELHDQSSQTLTALTLHAQILTEVLASRTAPDAALFSKQVSHINQLAERAMDEMRHVSEQLRPIILDDLGLEAALRWLVENARERLHLCASLDLEEVGAASQEQDVGKPRTRTRPRLPAEVETALFRIAQESLTNVARHAQASRVDLKLLRQPEQVTLLISDDGKGLSSAATQKTNTTHTGLGLPGMQERARLLGGRLDVASSPSQGTTIRAVIPLRATDAQKGYMQ
ncbi:MAG TPA: sensor histidine kinase [Ktedonobacterales bacterium]